MHLGDNEAAGRDPLLQESKTEYVLRPLREKVTITVASGPNGQTEEETVPVVPDLWLDFHFPLAKINHAPILIEIDRGTEGVKKFKQKILSDEFGLATLPTSLQRKMCVVQ